ncbi:MAG: multicopper oxidase domain-containing protein [Pseudonocardiaceae bacterium]
MITPRSTKPYYYPNAAPDDSQVPDTLRPLPPADKPATEREFVMSLNMQALRFEINHKPFDPDRVDVWPRLGSTEVWKIHNVDTALRIPHTFHTHLARFRILDRDGKPPGPGETGPQGHRVGATWRNRADPAALRRLHRALGLPLPSTRPRGQRDDGHHGSRPLRTCGPPGRYRYVAGQPERRTARLRSRI